MANSFLSSWKKYTILQMKTWTKTLYRPQFGFRQAEKKKNLKHYSHHKVINPDFKTSKNKRNEEILLREQ